MTCVQTLSTHKVLEITAFSITSLVVDEPRLNGKGGTSPPATVTINVTPAGDKGEKSQKSTK